MKFSDCGVLGICGFVRRLKALEIGDKMPDRESKWMLFTLGQHSSTPGQDFFPSIYLLMISPWRFLNCLFRCLSWGQLLSNKRLARGLLIQGSSACSPVKDQRPHKHEPSQTLSAIPLTVSAMMFLYSSTVVFNWAFCNKTNSFSATEDDVELFESPFKALLLFTLLLFRWLLLVTLLLLAIGEVLLVLLRLDLLLTSCILRFSNTLSSHFDASPSLDADKVSGKCFAKRSLTFVTSTTPLAWVWNKIESGWAWESRLWHVIRGNIELK